MTLYKKIFIFIFFVTIIIAGAIIVISRSVMLGGFEKVELDLMNKNQIRVEKALEQRITAISFYNRDWAFWNDTYEFVADRNQQYIDDNLSIDTTFESGNLSLIIFLNTEGEIIYADGFDLSTKSREPLPEGIEDYLKKDSPLVTHGSEHGEVNGIVVLPGGLYLVSSYPILNNDAQGPVRGSLVMGRKLSEEELSSLSQTTELSLKILKPNTPQKSTNQDTLFGYVVIKDIYGHDGFVVEIEKSRDIYQQGIKSVNFIVAFIVGAAIIFFLVFYYFIGRSVLLPISKLSQEVRKMGASGDFTKKVQISGTHEIASLGGDINKMLESLEELKNATESGREDLAGKLSELQNTKMAMINLLEDAKELEGTIISERDRANAIISSMGEGLLVIGKDYKVNMINKAAQELLGVLPDQALGKNWSELVRAFHGENEVPVGNRSFYKAITEKRTVITGVAERHYYQTLAGKKFPVASVTSPLYSGEEVVGAIKVFRDVTLERQAKEEIEKIVEERTKELHDKNIALVSAQDQITQGWLQVREEQARLTSSINALPLGFFIVDAGHNIIALNQRMKLILGSQEELVRFEAIEELFKATKFEFSRVCNHCRHDFNSYENKDVEYNGKFLRIFSVPVMSEGKLLGTAVLIEDITESKVLERSKDEFFSIASHELRTPLTAIRGNTSMIMDYFMPDLKDESVREMIKDIHESSIRLIGIVNDFLDVSRLEQKRLEFKQENIDIFALAKEVVEELKSSADGKVALDVKVPEGPLPPALADKNKVKEIFINLIGNALKFTEDGRVTISFETKDHIIEIFIADTGRGIPVNLQSLLFRKFQQAGESLMTRDTTKGTGLGLYISKLMVEGMGGKIRLVSSEPGKGSTFSFALPASN